MQVEPMRQDRLVGPGIKQQLKFFLLYSWLVALQLLICVKKHAWLQQKIC